MNILYASTLQTSTFCPPYIVFADYVQLPESAWIISPSNVNPLALVMGEWNVFLCGRK
jgi:Ca2+/H+ antiporter